MNAIGMFIVTEIIQAWILSMCIDVNYYDNLNHRKEMPPFLYQVASLEDHFQHSKICIYK